MAMPILVNIDFLPLLTDLAYRRWVQKGLVSINQLFENNTLRPFSQRWERFDLPSNILDRYLQIRHYITKHTYWDIFKGDSIGFEGYFIHISQQLVSKSIKYHVSISLWVLWKTQQTIPIGVGKNLIGRWRWDSLGPLLRYKVQKQFPNICWRNCFSICWRNNMWDHSHISWVGSVIQTYWKDIKEELDNFFRMDIPLDPLLFLLK